MTSPRQELLSTLAKAKNLLRGSQFASPKQRVRLERALTSNKKNGLGEAAIENAIPLQVGPESTKNPQPPWASALWSFEKQIKACERCELGRGRKNFVFGEGKKDARLLLVGEAPGADEDRLGRPFVGAAGQLLTRIILAMGFKREEVYISNVLKCRPPHNRDPEASEVEQCRPYVQHQIKLVQPQVVVTLGRFATQMLLETSMGIKELCGHWQQWQGIAVMPTFHPSAVLRDPRLKRQVWEDMKEVMKKLEEISS